MKLLKIWFVGVGMFLLFNWWGTSCRTKEVVTPTLADQLTGTYEVLTWSHEDTSGKVKTIGETGSESNLTVVKQGNQEIKITGFMTPRSQAYVFFHTFRLVDKNDIYINVYDSLNVQIGQYIKPTRVLSFETRDTQRILYKMDGKKRLK